MARLARCSHAHLAGHYLVGVCAVPPNPSLKLTPYGMRCLAAPGASGIMPSAAKQHMLPVAAWLER